MIKIKNIQYFLVTDIFTLFCYKHGIHERIKNLKAGYYINFFNYAIIYLQCVVPMWSYHLSVQCIFFGAKIVNQSKNKE